MEYKHLPLLRFSMDYPFFDEVIPAQNQNGPQGSRQFFVKTEELKDLMERDSSLIKRQKIQTEDYNLAPIDFILSIIKTQPIGEILPTENLPPQTSANGDEKSQTKKRRLSETIEENVIDQEQTDISGAAKQSKTRQKTRDLTESLGGRKEEEVESESPIKTPKTEDEMELERLERRRTQTRRAVQKSKRKLQETIENAEEEYEKWVQFIQYIDESTAKFTINKPEHPIHQFFPIMSSQEKELNTNDIHNLSEERVKLQAVFNFLSHPKDLSNHDFSTLSRSYDLYREQDFPIQNPIVSQDMSNNSDEDEFNEIFSFYKTKGDQEDSPVLQSEDENSSSSENAQESEPISVGDPKNAKLDASIEDQKKIRARAAFNKCYKKRMAKKVNAELENKHWVQFIKSIEKSTAEVRHNNPTHEINQYFPIRSPKKNEQGKKKILDLSQERVKLRKVFNHLLRLSDS